MRTALTLSFALYIGGCTAGARETLAPIDLGKRQAARPSQDNGSPPLPTGSSNPVAEGSSLASRERDRGEPAPNNPSLTQDNRNQADDLIRRTAEQLASRSRITRAQIGSSLGSPLPDRSDSIEAAPILIDGKVGNVNGRPILARRFFQEQQLEGRLRQLPIELVDRGVPESQLAASWTREARLIIRQALELVVRDEVLFRERLSNLPEDGPGLRFFLNFFREQLRRQSYGSLEFADRLTREQSNEEGLDEFLNAYNRDQAIQLEIEERVRNRVSVSWREVVNFYNRNYDQFNPPPRAIVRMMQFRATETAAIEQTREALEAGGSFEELAQIEQNLHQRDSGGLLTGEPVAFDGEFTKYEFIGDPVLNSAIVSLSAGGFAGPIEDGPGQGRWVWFVGLDGLDVSNRTLYDAQLDIERAIRSDKLTKATNRYVLNLVGDSSHTDVTLMTDRLVDYATRAYLDPWLEPLEN